MAAHGHGMAGSGETTAPRLKRVTLRASVACTRPSSRQRRDGKGARIAGRMERHLRRGQPWRRWKETAISPLPRHNWIDGGVEKVEGIMARLGARWLARFCSDERARRRRRSIRNGGRLRTRRCARRRREGSNGVGGCVRAGTGPLLERRRATWWLRPSMNATRRAAPAPVGHGGSERFLKFQIQRSTMMTDSVISTMHNSQTVVIWFMV